MSIMKKSKQSAFEFYRNLKPFDDNGGQDKKKKKKKSKAKNSSSWDIGSRPAMKRLLDIEGGDQPTFKKAKSLEEELDDWDSLDVWEVDDCKPNEVFPTQTKSNGAVALWGQMPQKKPEQVKLTKSQRKRQRRKRSKNAGKDPDAAPAKNGEGSSSAVMVESGSGRKEIPHKKKEKHIKTKLLDSLSSDKPSTTKEAMEELDLSEFSECSDQDEEPINPVESAEELLQSIIHPTEMKEFFKTYWEKKILHVKREERQYYADWFSTTDLDEILREHRVMFTEHIDVTSYKDGTRSTHNPEGRAYPSVVWDFFRSGCSVRMLCPQAFHESLAFKLNLLQEYFTCFVGANTYLTPPGMQGFAPHYDDIEAFVLQLEGSKKWRVYNPRNESEKLPRFSSGNFSQKEVGSPVMEVTLNAGDLLYFPRGMIHQAVCPDNEYSLHLTISTNQKNTWGDLLKKLMPAAVEMAMAKDVQFRQGLTPGYLRFMGSCVNSKKRKRQLLIEHVNKLVQKLVQQYLPIDDACDEMGKQLAHDSLPPILHDSETMHHVGQQGETWSDAVAGVINPGEVTPDTELRLVRSSCVRCLRGAGEPEAAGQGDEEEPRVAARLFHSLCNTHVYREVEPIFTGVSDEALSCIEKLIQAYPGFVKVEDFPLPELTEKLEVASSLYEMGLVITRELLEGYDDAPSDSDN